MFYRLFHRRIYIGTAVAAFNTISDYLSVQRKFLNLMQIVLGYFQQFCYVCDSCTWSLLLKKFFIVKLLTKEM